MKKIGIKKKSIRVDNKSTREDSWKNLVTGVGTSRDKRLYTNVEWENRPQEVYEQMYASDELASRIVNIVPEEALRKFCQWTNVESEQSEQIMLRLEELDLRGAIERTWKWGRAYGGACLYLVTDADDPSQPMEDGESIIGLQDFSRYDLTVMATDVETDMGKRNYGYPNIYKLTISMGTSSKVYPIHHTRMVRFDGNVIPRRTRIRNQYWHDSILNRLLNSIRNYQMANDAAASILSDFNVGVFKMKDLSNLIGAGREEQVRQRLEMLNFSKSTIRAMILDADGEEFVDLARSVDGLAELLSKQANRLVAATDIPHTKLLGESPDGSSATGNSTIQQWFDYVQSQQEVYLRPKLKRILDVVFPELKGTLGFKFNSLYQMTEAEEAALRLQQSQTDCAYIQAGVLDPTEVATSRFGGEQYSMETELDQESRDAGLIGPGSEHAEDLFGGQKENDDKESQGAGSLPPKPGVEPENGPDQRHEKTDDSGNYRFRNEEAPRQLQPQEKIESNVSSTQSIPKHERPWDLPGKPPNRPNNPRHIAPSVGDGIIAPSGGAPPKKVDISNVYSIDEIKKRIAALTR